MGKKAFEIELDGIKGIVFSEKAGFARYIAYLSALDAGFSPKFMDIKVKRSKIHDYLSEVVAKNRCYSMDYIDSINI